MGKKKTIFGILGLAAALFLSVPVQAQTVRQIQVTPDKNGTIGKALQKALDVALEDQSGEVLYEINLPSGTYGLGEQLLKVYSYTTINMNGCKLERKTSKTMLRLGKEEESYSGYNGYHDIIIENGTFDGKGNTLKSDASLVRLGHASGITFRNVTFQNAYKSHHVELAGCENITFDQCTFKNFYTNQNEVNSANNEALQFDVIHNKTHFPKYPEFDDTPCRNITVNQCQFSNLQRGLGTHSGVAGSYFTNMQFTNNVFNNVKGYAIIATNYKDSIISGNTISQCGAGILFRSMVQGHNNFYTPLETNFLIDNNANSVIENNLIAVTDYKYSTTAYGISLYGEKITAQKKNVPKGDYTLKGVAVRYNTITMNNSGYGIWLQGTNDSEVSANKVTMNIKASVSGKGNADGIRLVKSKNILIQSNTLNQKKKNKKTSEACGIVVRENSQATIQNNRITNSPKDGIFVIAKSKVIMTGNTIKKTGRYGLNVCDKSTVVNKNNKMTKCKKRVTNTYSGGKIKKK